MNAEQYTFNFPALNEPRLIYTINQKGERIAARWAGDDLPPSAARQAIEEREATTLFDGEGVLRTYIVQQAYAEARESARETDAATLALGEKLKAMLPAKSDLNHWSLQKAMDSLPHLVRIVPSNTPATIEDVEQAREANARNALLSMSAAPGTVFKNEPMPEHVESAAAYNEAQKDAYERLGWWDAIEAESDASDRVGYCRSAVLLAPARTLSDMAIKLQAFIDFALDDLEAQDGATILSLQSDLTAMSQAADALLAERAA